MGAEGVYVAKRRIFHARCGMAVVQKLANVRSTAAHLFKPRLGEPSQLVIRLGKPSINGRGLAERRSGIAGVCSSDQQASYCK
jgi:hypothetical protein